MAKWNAVGFGAESAEVDPETIESFYDEATYGVPPKGVYRGVVKRLQSGVTSESAQNPGQPKMKCVFEIAEPKGTAKAKYNGYGMWIHRPVDPEVANRVNQFLQALLDGTKLTSAKRKAVIKAFWTGNVQLDDNDFITKIGTWVIPEEIEVAATTRGDKYNGEVRLAVGNLLPISDAPKPKPSDSDDDEDDDDEDVEDEEATDDEEADEEEDEEESEEDEGDEADVRFDELMAMPRAKLVKLYKETIEGAKVLKSTKEDDMANAIVDVEFAESEEDEEEEEPEDEEEEDEEEPEEDEEDEPAPLPPPRRTARTTATKTAKASAPAPSGRGKARAGSSKAPAARRRSGKGDEPPF